jgi:3-oxoacyl-[acyl-carrier protein] reductase
MSTLIVTGASRGIGRCIAEQAHASGHRVIGLARHGRDDPDLPFELRACDVSEPGAINAALRDVRDDDGLCGLINAAGIASMNLVLTMPPETMQRVVATNLLGTMFSCQVVGRLLVRRGGGRIINFSTIAVPLGLSGEAVYAASKAGVEVFSRAFAREMSAHGVCVNTIAPGPIDTGMLDGVDRGKIERIVDRQVITRQATPLDVWDVVKLLLAPESSMISGQVIHVGGV